MSGETPPSFERDFGAATTNLRDTAKWIVGTVATTATGVLVGGSLAKLGALVDQRLVLAVASLLVGLTVLAVVYWFAIKVIAVEPVKIPALIAQIKAGDRRARKVELAMADKLPEGCRTFADLAAFGDVLFAAGTPDADTLERRDRFTAEVHALTPELAFWNKQVRFGELEWALAICTPVLALCIIGLSWAANPPPDPAPISKAPAARRVEIPDDPTNEAALAYKPGCYAIAAGRIAVVTVVVAEYPGYSDVMAFPRPPCPIKRLVLQNDHLVSP